MSVTVPLDSTMEEVEIELDELPPGIGMLVVTRGPNSGSKYALDEPLVTAGRHPDSVIFLDDITVSRRHAEVRQRADGGYEVADVGSLNGTYLNRERVESAALKDGDELQIGTFKLLFLAGRP
jgi:pSer/pThr/pTyr-binding forkhead associated (FHA) protein